MRQKPSFTARRVAAQRALLARPAGPGGDPGAEQRLYAGLQQGRLFPHLDKSRMAGRTRWFDDATFRMTEDPRWLGDRVCRAALDGILSFVGETRMTEFRDGDPERVLEQTGWRIVRRDVSDRTRLDGGSHGLLVVASPT